MPASPPRLPAIGRLIVRLTFPIAERNEVTGDFAAELHERRHRDGWLVAQWWLWRQLARSTPSLLRRGVWRGQTGFESPASRMRPGGAPLESLVMDLRFALRRLRSRPMYATLAVFTLALGVGGSSAIYAITHAFLVEPLPFAHEDKLAVFWHVGDWSEEELVYLHGTAPGFAAIAGYRATDVTLRQDNGAAEAIHGAATTAQLFDVLGTRPIIGRTFAPGEDAQSAAPVAVVSFDLWQELGGDQSIMGHHLNFDGTPRTVIGVMPAGFWFPAPTTRFWIPVPLDTHNQVGNYGVIGRIADGTSMTAIAGRLSQLRRILADRFTGDAWPTWLKAQPSITPMRDYLFGPLRPALFATLVSMGFILLIACANVAALMLGQVEGRTTELAVRAALGADRARIAQQLLVESIIVGVLAAALGAGIAAVSFRVLVTALPLGALAARVTLSPGLFGAALVIALAAAILVALLPIFALWRGDLRDALAHSRTGGIGGGSRIAGTLVVAEVALALLMATGAGLLVHSVTNLYNIDPGVARRGVAVVDVVSPADMSVDQRRHLFHSLSADLQTVAGVKSVSTVQQLPLRGRGWTTGLVIPERPDIGRVTSFVRIAGPNYFETMGIPLTSGRDFSNADAGDREAAIVINAALATKYFGNVDPIGKQINTGFGAMGRVVGIVGNVTEADLTDPAAPVRYLSYDQVPFMVANQTIVVRAARGDATSLLAPIRRAIQRRAPGVAIQQATTIDAVIDYAVGPARQIMLLLALLTTLALVLGAIGVYGVISHFVTRRRREWSIRIALGLAPSKVVRHVVGRGTRLVMSGIVVGIAGTVIMAKLVTPFLYGIRANDSTSIIAAALVLIGVGVLAALIPALRAGRVDPALVLRDQ